MVSVCLRLVPPPPIVYVLVSQSALGSTLVDVDSVSLGVAFACLDLDLEVDVFLFLPQKGQIHSNVCSARLTYVVMIVAET